VNDIGLSNLIIEKRFTATMVYFVTFKFSELDTFRSGTLQGNDPVSELLIVLPGVLRQSESNFGSAVVGQPFNDMKDDASSIRGNCWISVRDIHVDQR
jgi:hypothetical protein